MYHNHCCYYSNLSNALPDKTQTLTAVFVFYVISHYQLSKLNVKTNYSVLLKSYVTRVTDDRCIAEEYEQCLNFDIETVS